MLRSQAALRELTGSREMSVFHTLFAGNIGQRGAPGTVVPGMAIAVAPGESVDGPRRTARLLASPDLAAVAGPLLWPGAWLAAVRAGGAGAVCAAGDATAAQAAMKATGRAKTVRRAMRRFRLFCIVVILARPVRRAG